jgi:hypothetical protein
VCVCVRVSLCAYVFHKYCLEQVLLQQPTFWIRLI